MQAKKKFWHSRMIWINILAILGSVISGIFTKNWLDGETQLMVLAMIDLILRFRTNKGLGK